MIITDVRAAVVRSQFRWIIVQVRTDSGLTGIGEAWYAPGVLESLAEAQTLIAGQDPRAVAAHVTGLTRGRRDTSAVGMDWDALSTRHGLGGGFLQEGPTVMAAGGIEIALLDILARSVGAPVHVLLGGGYRSKVALYAHLTLNQSSTADPTAAYAEAADAAITEGFQALKIDVDSLYSLQHADAWGSSRSRRELDQVIGCVERLRDHLGAHVGLALDCHSHFSPADAISLTQGVSAYDVLWLEDPVRLGRPSTLAQVAQATTVPICIGEYIPTAAQLHPYLDVNACDIVHPDVCYAGPRQVLDIASLAELYQRPCALHNSGGPIATAAAAHVATAIRDFVALEILDHHASCWQELVDWRGSRLEGSVIELSPIEPGLGVELQRDGCKHFVDDYEVLF
jgi:L-alanine-DL-glutamate epimerase-like enolase superfamily enzyme